MRCKSRILFARWLMPNGGDVSRKVPKNGRLIYGGGCKPNVVLCGRKKRRHEEILLESNIGVTDKPNVLGILVIELSKSSVTGLCGKVL